MRLFRVALLRTVGLEATHVLSSSRVDEWDAAVWPQDEILDSSQNERPSLTCNLMRESWQHKIKREKSHEITFHSFYKVKNH